MPAAPRAGCTYHRHRWKPSQRTERRSNVKDNTPTCPFVATLTLFWLSTVITNVFLPCAPPPLLSLSLSLRYHLLAAILNLLRSQQVLKDQVVKVTGLLPTIVMLLASCHDATRRAALSFLATIMIDSTERREAVALAGALQPLERLAERSVIPEDRQRARALLDELE